MSKLRFSLALAAAAGLLAWWWAEVPAIDSAPRATQAPRTLAASEPPPADLQFQRRALAAASRDPFGTPPKPPPPKRDLSPRVEVPPPPKAPPLPFQYDGSGVLQGKSFVFLKRQNRTFMVSAGDTIEGTYGVERVARDRVVLRYLPLGIRQVLMYATGAEAPPEVADAPEIGRTVALQVDMPVEVLLGEEFVVTVVLPADGALKATVEVAYDAEVLRMVGAKPRRPGRAVIEVAGGNAPRAQLRFQVLAETPASTDIDLQVRATDASGRRVAVSAPSVHTVSLVQPGA